MKIFLIGSIDEITLRQVISDNVFYRPDLLYKKTTMLAQALISQKVDAVITSVDLPFEAIKLWKEAMPLTYLVHVNTNVSEIIETSNVSIAEAHIELFVRGENMDISFLSAFRLLEQKCTLNLVGSPNHLATRTANNAKRVLIVGAGVVNLVTAYTLQTNGYQVHILDRSPDPRENSEWTKYGCSRGGGDARMFSFSEMNCYNDKKVTKSMNNLFSRRVDKLGWSIYNEGTLTSTEQGWIVDFENLPTWLASQYNQDIFGFNKESHLLWEKWKIEDPELFSSSFLKEGIYRLFSDKDTFRQKASIQSDIGACKKLLSPKDVANLNPILEEAVQNGLIAGGIDEIGFTVQVHQFIHELIDRLQKNGADFSWNQEASDILFDTQNKVTGIKTKEQIFTANHYVISTGVYGGTLLNGTLTEGKIHGVLGVWVELPNIEPHLENSLKLRRTGHITEAANITVSKDSSGNHVLILGSGYGYTGINPNNIDEELLDQLYDGLIDTAKKYFPKAYHVAFSNNTIEDSLKYCLRPWTSNSLGVFETIQTRTSGKCIITGGHNTGGFAQSPSIAQAVLLSLNSCSHKMHSMYHPKRSSEFLSVT
jgi:glycine/D-amino acid oxidase-like deaminating enzyme